MPLATFSYFIGLRLGICLSVAQSEHTISDTLCHLFTCESTFTNTGACVQITDSYVYLHSSVNIYVISLQNLAINICNEKSDWIDHTPDATTQEFLTQKVHLDEALSSIWIKLSEPRKFSVDYF